MRLIDADALHKPIYAEDDNITGIGMTYDEMDAYNCGIKETWKIVEEAPTVEPASPWHMVEEELPEIGQIVLVYDEWRRLSICQLDNSYRWLRQGGGWFNGPCACYWMPIEPPKEENDGN